MKTVVVDAQVPDVQESDEYSGDTDDETCLRRGGDPALLSELENTEKIPTRCQNNNNDHD